MNFSTINNSIPNTKSLLHFIDFLTSPEEESTTARPIINSSNGIVENPDGTVNLDAARRNAAAHSKPGKYVMIGNSEKPTVVNTAEEMQLNNNPDLSMQDILSAEDEQFVQAA